MYTYICIYCSNSFKVLQLTNYQNRPQVCEMHVFPKSNHSYTLTCSYSLHTIFQCYWACYKYCFCYIMKIYRHRNVWTPASNSLHWHKVSKFYFINTFTQMIQTSQSVHVAFSTLHMQIYEPLFDDFQWWSSKTCALKNTERPQLALCYNL